MGIGLKYGNLCLYTKLNGWSINRIRYISWWGIFRRRCHRHVWWFWAFTYKTIHSGPRWVCWWFGVTTHLCVILIASFTESISRASSLTHSIVRRLWWCRNEIQIHATLHVPCTCMYMYVLPHVYYAWLWGRFGPSVYSTTSNIVEIGSNSQTYAANCYRFNGHKQALE